MNATQLVNKLLEPATRAWWIDATGELIPVEYDHLRWMQQNRPELAGLDQPHQAGWVRVRVIDDDNRAELWYSGKAPSFAQMKALRRLSQDTSMPLVYDGPGGPKYVGDSLEINMKWWLNRRGQLFPAPEGHKTWMRQNQPRFAMTDNETEEAFAAGWLRVLATSNPGSNPPEPARLWLEGNQPSATQLTALRRLASERGLELVYDGPAGPKYVGDSVERIDRPAVRWQDESGEERTHSLGPHATHPEIIRDLGYENPGKEEWFDRGFLTSTGRFVEREAAYRIAHQAGQIAGSKIGYLDSGPEFQRTYEAFGKLLVASRRST